MGEGRASASWPCAACGNVAAAVTLLPAGEPDPGFSLTRDRASASGGDVMQGYDRLAVVGGPVGVTLGVGLDLPAITDALSRGDARALFELDREFAPFWCPDCGACYCGEHYTHWDVWDDGFFDCVRGQCPRGHQRMLMD